jgi:uncharacterized protein (TIGR02145 family)
MKNLFTLTHKHIWKAIAFLTAVFSLFIFTACGPDAPTVETLSAYHESLGSVVVIGKITSDGGDEAVEYGFCLSKHAEPTINDKLVFSHILYDNRTTFRATFFDLDKNTTYYVRAFAMNVAGTGYGEVMEVTTSTLPIVFTQGWERVSNTEARLRATVYPQNSETEVWFEAWPLSGEVLKFSAPKVSGADSVSVSVLAEGLTPGIFYSYCVKAQNTSGAVSGKNANFQLYHLYDQVTDYDGNKYWTVKIGNQIWLAENLRTKHFLNGDPIPNVQPDAEWVAMKSPAWCYTKNDPELGEVYGCLYNNYVGLDPRGLIAGYHTPSIQEYETLVGYLGGGTIAPRKLKSATDDWSNLGKGDNSSGFNALPGGWRSDKNTPFSTLYYQASFQTTTKMEGLDAYYGADIYSSNREVMTVGASGKYLGCAIRLIKN